MENGIHHYDEFNVFVDDPIGSGILNMKDTLLLIDGAIVDLVCAKATINYVGRSSDHVQKAKFDRFVRNIDEIVKEMLTVGMKISEEM